VTFFLPSLRCTSGQFGIGRGQRDGGTGGNSNASSVASSSPFARWNVLTAYRPSSVKRAVAFLFLDRVMNFEVLALRATSIGMAKTTK